MNRIRPLLIMPLALALLGLTPSAVAAQVPTLEGEFFEGTADTDGSVFNDYPANGSNPAGCDPNGVSTIEFTQTGVAIGPYPGVYTEHVVIKIGRQSAVGTGSQPEVLRGPVLSVSAEFTIDSPLGQVTGTKELAPSPPGSFLTNTGSCFGVSAPTGTGFAYPYLSDFTFSNRGAIVHLAYEATINSSTGETYKDSGNAFARFNEGRFSGTCTGGDDPTTIAFCNSVEDITGDRHIDNYFFSNTGFEETFYRSDGLIPLGPAIVVLDPVTAVNPVDTRHTVTATATTATGEPTEGVRIEFTIVGVSSEEQGATIERSCRTNQDGQCDITYEGPTFPGVDVITACADSDEDGERDADEPCGEATKEWVLPGSTPGKTTGGGQILHLNSTGTTFGFTFESDGVSDDSIRGECLVLDHAPADDKVDCLNVLAYVQSANEATIYGNATLNGEDAGLFRMHVVDNGESGIGQDVFEFETQHGYVRTGVLTEGDIQVHQ